MSHLASFEFTGTEHVATYRAYKPTDDEVDAVWKAAQAYAYALLALNRNELTVDQAANIGCKVHQAASAIGSQPVTGHITDKERAMVLEAVKRYGEACAAGYETCKEVALADVEQALTAIRV